ncbi:MAG TPA: M20/M25/M40 family metallo-hydrolase [Anaerovoracaceae bacterium]|nr:M20/M25/M40 family metallo-hydrolase [Anaerovoracaceae bacterium]
MTFIEKNKDRMLEDLRGLLAIPSVSSNLLEVEKALDYVLNLAKSMGMSTKKVVDGTVGVIEVEPTWGNSSETLGILAHVDVVDPGDWSLWEHQPFDGDISGGKIIGRGTLDDKGPLIACIYALKAAMENGKAFTKKVQIIIGTQEETEWTDMEAYSKAFPMPDYGFTPDGDFPICNIEKGCYDIFLDFPLEEDEEYMKPGEIYLTTLAAGTATNIVPGTCTAILSNGEEILIKGKAVHSCQPEKGRNAIFDMANELAARGISDNRLLRILYMLKDKFEDCYGENLGLTHKEEYYNGEFIHKNVFTPVIIQMTEHSVKVCINVRFAYTTDSSELTALFEGICREEKGSIVEISSLPAVYVSKERPFLRMLAEAYEEETPFKNDFVLGYGGSYAKVMPNMVSWGPIFPGMEDTCHEENEYINIEDLMTNVRVYYKAITKIIQSEESFL